MNTPENASTVWWDDFVDDYVDGSLSDEDMSRLDALKAIDTTLASQIELSRAMRTEFRAMSNVKCPEWVMQDVKRDVRADLLRNMWTRGWETLVGFSTRQLRPVLATATLIGIVILSSRIGVTGTTTDPAVARALDDVKWTLAYLSEVTRQTGSAVRTEALEPLVLNSMQHAVDSFIDN